MDETEATKRTKDYHTTIRTVFFKRGRHSFNIKVKQCGNVGIGIVGTDFDIYKDQWIWSTNDSYGTWAVNSEIAYYNGAQVKERVKHKLVIKTGVTVKIDLDLYDRTFIWEIDGIRLTDDVKIQFDGPVAVAACIYCSGDTVQIIQYFHQ